MLIRDKRRDFVREIRCVCACVYIQVYREKFKTIGRKKKEDVFLKAGHMISPLKNVACTSLCVTKNT